MLEQVKEYGQRYFNELSSQTLSMLKVKYSEDFSIEDMIPMNIDNTHDEVFCHAEQRGRLVNVYRFHEDNNFVFLDNYYGIIKEEEYFQMMKKLLSSYFTDFCMGFRCLADYFNNELDEKVPLSVAIKDYPQQFFADVAVVTNMGRTDAKNAFDRVCKEIGDRGIEARVRVFVSDELVSDEIECVDVYSWLRERNMMTADLVATIKQD